MKKIFNKFTKLLLTFILLFSDIAPLVKVFADMNPILTIKASTSLEGEYDEIQNNTTYTFDQSTNIDNYYFKLNGNSFEESENYLKITICDNSKIIFSSIIRKLRMIKDIDVLDVAHMSRKMIKDGTEKHRCHLIPQGWQGS